MKGKTAQFYIFFQCVTRLTTTIIYRVEILVKDLQDNMVHHDLLTRFYNPREDEDRVEHFCGQVLYCLFLHNCETLFQSQLTE